MKRSLLKLAVSATLLSAAGAALAGTDVGQWTIGAGGMWTATDKDRGVYYATPVPGHFNRLDDGFGFNYSVGYAMSERWDLSLNGFSGNHDEAGTTWDREIKGLTMDFDRVFHRDARISPFLSFGFGVIDQHRPGIGVPTNEVVAKVGVGVLGDLVEFSGGNKLQLKMTAGARNSLGKHFTDFVVGLGLQMAFGAGKPEPIAAPPPPPPPATTTPGPRVRCRRRHRRHHHPPPPRPAPPPPPPPADDDRDGVVNTADRCPGTPAGNRVDSNGCSLRAPLKVFFDTDSAVLKPESFAELDNMARFLTEVLAARGVVEGHTDNVGTNAYNQALSQRRADSVRKYLIDKGIAADRLQAKGFGESQPDADNKTVDGRAQNRRVTFQRTDVK